MALQWIILGAVLNPTAILPYSVAVGGALGFIAASVVSIRNIRKKMYERAMARIRKTLNKVMNQVTPVAHSLKGIASTMNQAKENITAGTHGDGDGDDDDDGV